MGGAIGSILIGALADADVGGVAASGELFGKQLAATLLCAAYSYLFSFVVLFVMTKVWDIKPSPEQIKNVDMSLHGESAYPATLTPGSSIHKGSESEPPESFKKPPPKEKTLRQMEDGGFASRQGDEDRGVPRRRQRLKMSVPTEQACRAAARSPCLPVFGAPPKCCALDPSLYLLTY